MHIQRGTALELAASGRVEWHTTRGGKAGEKKRKKKGKKKDEDVQASRQARDKMPAPESLSRILPQPHGPRGRGDNNVVTYLVELII